MSSDVSQIGVLIRREIEAAILKPLIEAFGDKFGQEATMEIVAKVIEESARENGRQLAAMLGGDNLEDFINGLPLWSKNGALEIEILEQAKDKLSMNITRCRYVDMYRRLGMEELGYALSCARDPALFTGFNEKIDFQRTQTIMEGAPFCDFRVTMKK